MRRYSLIIVALVWILRLLNTFVSAFNAHFPLSYDEGLTNQSTSEPKSESIEHMMISIDVFLGRHYFDTTCMNPEHNHRFRIYCNKVPRNIPCNKYSSWGMNRFKKCNCTCDMCGTDKREINEPVAKSLDDGMCYPLYSKANCYWSNEWFYPAPGTNKFGQCTPNPCNQAKMGKFMKLNETSIFRLLGMKHSTGHYPLNPEWVFHQGKCVQPFALGGCGPPGGNYILYFLRRMQKPICAEIDLISVTIRSFWDLETQTHSNTTFSRDISWPYYEEFDFDDWAGFMASSHMATVNRRCLGGFAGVCPSKFVSSKTDSDDSEEEE